MRNDSNYKMVAQNSRYKQEYDRRLLSYEKEFDVGVSRVVRRDKAMNDSMLAYTERMRKITNARMNPDRDFTSPDDVPLVVRAKHIPKFPAPSVKRRRPASLDELIGKSKSKRDKPKSASRLSLPMLPERYGKGAHRVKISFVSASDLYDIVDFSIRTKANKEETLKYLRMENDSKLSKKSQGGPERPNNALPREAFSKRENEGSKGTPNEVDHRLYMTLPPIKSKDSDDEDGDDGDELDEIDSEIKQTTEMGKLAPDALRRRPNRARRMHITKPELRSIPEDDVASLRQSGKSERTLPSPPLKQSPRNVINIKPQLGSIPENELSQDLEHQIALTEKKKLSKLNRKENSHGVTAMVKVEPFPHTDRHTDIADVDPHLKVKLKAQKRFRRLIFLRDVPDRNHRI
ncbi:hypothetical protein FSP39_020906 [Pinctada imbricata]|uniref:Uncharacterized protein n=1 Tax=Pinctada imbricata TaxID=66713 RepID=A0AA89BY11_PINIB|nr:hypothetical protein FSP39_020906 [Pinctada imbricata]